MKIIADENIPFVKECFSSIAEVTTISGRDITAGHVKDADALLVRSITKVNAGLLAGSKVKFVATATIGFEHIDLDYLAENNIGFASAPGSNANSVAEYVTAGLLELGCEHDFDLSQKTIGIIGVGNVGSRVAKKCEGLGMKVVLNDPPLQRQTGDDKYRPIEELYDCDIITTHTPLTRQGPDKTYHLACEKFFGSLNQPTIYINTSRGAVADTESVKAAIKSGKLKHVILDVWENEPEIDNELLQMVDIASPHIAGYSYDGKVAGMVMIYGSACEHFDIAPTQTIADFLPAAQVPEINIDPAGKSMQEVLRDTVKKIYDITTDDSNTRKILTTPPEQKASFFDGLRKSYAIRREFQNTTILVNDSGIAGKLGAIGFKV